MGKIKENAHIGCLLFFTCIVVFLAIYLGKSLSFHGERETQNILKDTARVNAAYRTYERIRMQQLSEDPDVQKLANGVLDMREHLDNIKVYAEEAESYLDELGGDAYVIDDIKALLEDIIDECQ